MLDVGLHAEYKFESRNRNIPYATGQYTLKLQQIFANFQHTDSGTLAELLEALLNVRHVGLMGGM
jgi:hypothetical protein